MSRIAFVDTISSEKQGVLCLSSILKEHSHHVDVFLEPLENDFLVALQKFSPDIVAFGSFLSQEMEVLRIFTEIKHILPTVKTVQGGPSTILYSDLIYHDSVDFVLIGDGEDSLVSLIKEIEIKNELSGVPGLVWKNRQGRVVRNERTPLVNDLSKYPLPDRDLYMKYPLLKDLRTKSFLMTRGCPFKCSYCGSATLNRFFKDKKEGNHFRLGCFERIIEEIKYVEAAYGLEWVQFHDSTFNVNYEYTIKFLKKYIEEKLPPFICNIRSENLTEEMALLMKEARCDRVTIGIQSGSERIRKELSGRAAQTNENIIHACNLFRKHGIRVHIDLIFGWPGETIEEALETIVLARKTQANKLNSDVMIYYPGAAITENAFKNGFLEKYPDVFDLSMLSNPFNIPLLKTPDLKKLINLDKLVYFFVHFKFLSWPPLRRFILCMPPNRFYLFLKVWPEMRLSLKYDAKSFKERVTRIFLYIKESINIKKSQSLKEQCALKSKEILGKEVHCSQTMEKNPA